MYIREFTLARAKSHIYFSMNLFFLSYTLIFQNIHQIIYFILHLIKLSIFLIF